MDIKDLLTHTLDEKPSEFNDTFKDLLLNKLETAVANKKIEIAQSLFPDNTEVENDSVEEIEDESTDA